MKKILAILSLILMIGMIVNFSPEESPPEKQELQISVPDQDLDVTTYRVAQVQVLDQEAIPISTVKASHMNSVKLITSTSGELKPHFYQKANPTTPYLDKEKDPGRCGSDIIS